MYHCLWSQEQQRRHRRRNTLQSLLLLGGMVGLLSACGWIVAGGEGVLWALLGGGLSLALSPRLSPWVVLRLYRAVPLRRGDIPELFALRDEICLAAGLRQAPPLFYLPSPVLNALTVGHGDEAAIALTDGLLRSLDLREVAGVLAHEVSHIRNADTWVMGLADTIARLTRMLSMLGLLLLGLSLPAMLAGGDDVPWLLILLLVFAPTIGGLLQLALSRTREFEADLDAAGITGDPAGLALALAKMERLQGRFWEEILLPGRRSPDPSLLRTHPSTDERIERLMSLQAPSRTSPSPETIILPDHWPAVTRRPRWTITGLWY
jgi:heat shock protein HtpX